MAWSSAQGRFTSGREDKRCGIRIYPQSRDQLYSLDHLTEALACTVPAMYDLNRSWLLPTLIHSGVCSGRILAASRSAPLPVIDEPRRAGAFAVRGCDLATRQCSITLQLVPYRPSTMPLFGRIFLEAQRSSQLALLNHIRPASLLCNAPKNRTFEAAPLGVPGPTLLISFHILLAGKYS